MLPSLRKINDADNRMADTYKENNQDKYHKLKAAGGFRITPHEDTPNNDKIPIKSLIYPLKKSTTDLSAEIKMIERKIRQCQKKLEEQKRRKQAEKNPPEPYQQDFQNIIRREMELQGYQQQQQQPPRFDYLTNPGGEPQEQPQQVNEETIEQPQEFNINQGIQKLQKFYENSLKKKFERRELFPHKACRRKTPKLYITQKTNALSKYGKPSEQQHKFRVLTKQVTPQQIYPVIPNFAVVKDNLSKNIVAYLGDYKPFLDKTKEKVEKELHKTEEIAINISP